MWKHSFLFYGEFGKIPIIYWRNLWRFGGWLDWIRGDEGEECLTPSLPYPNAFFTTKTQRKKRKHSLLDHGFDSENSSDSSESEWLFAFRSKSETGYVRNVVRGSSLCLSE